MSKKQVLAMWWYRWKLRRWEDNQQSDKWAYKDGELPKYSNVPRPKPPNK